MSKNIEQLDRERLRLNGFSITPVGHIDCNRDGARWSHERCGVLKIEISRDSKDARALVDAVIQKIDEPRATTGRDRRGGAVLLFRCDRGVNNIRHELATRDGTEISIIFGSDGLTVDIY